MAGYLTTHVLDTARGCPAEGLKIAPKLVRFSQIAPGLMRLPEAGQSKLGVPVISPATSRLPTGSVPEMTSACTPSSSRAATVASNTLLRVVVRTSLLVTK